MKTTKTFSLSLDTLGGPFFDGLSDELAKIAEAAPPPQPELSKFQKFMRNTALLSAGTGAGLGAAMLADKLFETTLGPKWNGLNPKTKKRLLSAAAGLASAGVFIGREWNAHERKEAQK